MNEAYGVLSDETKRRVYDGMTGGSSSSSNAGGRPNSHAQQAYGTASETAQHAPHVQAWYVGQKEISQHQRFFYEKSVGAEQRCVQLVAQCCVPPCCLRCPRSPHARTRALFRGIPYAVVCTSLIRTARRSTAKQARAANKIRIVPHSRARSLLWLATPVFVAALWGFNAFSASGVKKGHMR